MLFQRFTTLIALMVFASQGAIALPHPATGDDPQGLRDNVLDNAGKASGTIWSSVVPANMNDESIKAAGGATLPHPASDASQGLTDKVFDNAGKASGTVWGFVIPANMNDEAIKAAGGIVPP
ncbi:hypothetical protein BYT27DRAFT_7263502 [Phlegmacium glaucopus]|nr:hypothetical protein BYT27DRAFT_7263502 [Phlegmacium glaucopus]